MSLMFIMFVLLLSPDVSAQSKIFSIRSDKSILSLKPVYSQSPYFEEGQQAITLDGDLTEVKDSETIQFDLDKNFTLTARKQKIVPSRSGFIWFGKVDHDPSSYVSLNINAKQVIGEIFAGGKVYRVQKDLKNQFYISSLQASHQNPMEDLESLKAFAQKSLSSRATVTEPSSDNFIDVLLVYSTDAATNSNIEPMLEANMVVVNDTLEQSCINFRYRLLDVRATTHTSAGDMSSDLSTLITLPDVTSARDALGADLVQMTIDAPTTYCGLGYTASYDGSQNRINFNEAYGYSVYLYGCPAYTMSHEMGHNLSLLHDRYQHGLDFTEEVSHPEKYGFVDTVNQIRSVMSYSDHCRDNGFNCTRIGKFSNPNIIHSGIPFGREGYANAAHVLNTYYGYVANYREAVTPYDPNFTPSCGGDQQGKDLHCFIATAAFGSSLHPKVEAFRSIRDHFLKKFAMGRWFIKKYYQYSPSMAYFIEQNPFWKSSTRVVLSSLLFIWDNPWPLVLLILLVLPMARGLTVFILFLFLLFPQWAQANIAISNYFEDIAPDNPSLLLDSQSGFVLAAQYGLSQFSGEGNLTKVEESFSYPQAYFAYTSPSFALGVRYQSPSEQEEKLTTLPFSEVVTKTEIGDLSLQLASNLFFGLPGGIEFSQKTSTSKDILKINKMSLDMGGQIPLGSLFSLGGGLIFNKEVHEDLALNQKLPEAQYLSAYAGIGMNTSQGLSGYGTTGSSQKSGLQMELSYFRDPEVIETSGTLNLVLPETSTIRIYGQYAFSGLSSQPLLMSFAYRTINRSSVDFYISESYKSNWLDASIGQGIGPIWLSGHISLLTESGGYDRSGSQILLSLSWQSMGMASTYSY